MEITHVNKEDNGTVTVYWNMTMEEYKALLNNAEIELDSTKQTMPSEPLPSVKREMEQPKRIITKVPCKECHAEPCDCDEEYLPTSQRCVTGERGFQTRDRDRSGRDSIEDDLYVKGDN